MTGVMLLISDVLFGSAAAIAVAAASAGVFAFFRGCCQKRCQER